MICPACGADNREGARFCRDCGLKLLEDGGQPSLEVEEIAVEEEVSGTEAQEAAPEGVPPEEAAEAEAVLADEPVEEVVPEDEEAEDAAETEAEQAATTVEPTLEEPIIEAVSEQVSAEGEDITPVESVEQEEPEEVPVPPGPAGEDEPAEPVDEVLAFWREEVELMTPIEPGTVIGGRYVVTEALDVQEHEILYHADDLRRCWQCGYEENDPEGTFCARCGVLMDRRPDVRLLEVVNVEAEPSTDKVVVARLSHESRHFLLLAEPEPEPELEAAPEPPSIRLLVGQRSDAGQVRELDEDSLFVMSLLTTYESRTGPVLGLFVVADGMGGHAGGEVASRMALQVLADRVMQTVIAPELAGALVLEDEILALLRQATMAANDAVYLDRKKRESDMGTTLTTAFVRDNRLFLAHVGDSRAYRWNADGLEQLTTDHSVIASMIAEGQAKPEELYSHPHRSIIYRCIGDKPLVDVDTDVLPLAPGDRIILCCDGLWEMIRDEGIEDVMMQEADPQVACDLLVRQANAAGGDDNISVIVVRVEAVEEVED